MVGSHILFNYITCSVYENKHFPVCKNVVPTSVGFEPPILKDPENLSSLTGYILNRVFHIAYYIVSLFIIKILFIYYYFIIEQRIRSEDRKKNIGG